jgi:membrane glycosyltransferase
MSSDNTSFPPGISLTPTGTQSAEVLTLRRIIVGVLNVGLFIGLALWAASILGAGGWTLVDVLLFICFLGFLPWTVLGFWNALIGLYLLHGSKNAIPSTAPFAALKDPEAPLTLKTAIFMTLRNEDPSRALLRMKLIKAEVDATGQGDKFGWLLLSDTNKDDVAAEEEAGVAAWKAEAGEGATIIYRRRTDNTGFKAGNVRDFLERWGDEYELFLPLDADSLMDAATILKNVRIMQENPKIGILQTLVVGLPSKSAFARIFQFGMRQGMRSYITGQTWWTGECGQFWGHNALARTKPFRDECHLPVLSGEPPFGGHILSHDQVEATFMRRAGYEVRLVPEECGSWEENPPTLIEFMKRNTRWCQGNLQYFKLLKTPGLFPISRFQLIWAILMFVSIPGWTFLMPLAAIKPFDGEGLANFPYASALCLYLTFLVISQMPKLCGLADILLTKGGAARYGGAGKVLFAGVVEIFHSWIMGASDSFRTTFFIAGLLLGKSVTWGGQARDAHGVPWDVAVSNLWPQTVFGVFVFGLMAKASLCYALWTLPLTLGYLIAIPFAVISASPALGARMKARGLFAVPEEVNTPDIVAKAQAGEA